jgi:hypothetical protein
MATACQYVTTVAPLRFDKARIEKLLAVASEQLDGEWLLIGGAAAAAWTSSAGTSGAIRSRTCCAANRPGDTVAP